MTSEAGAGCSEEDAAFAGLYGNGFSQEDATAFADSNNTSTYFVYIELPVTFPHASRVLWRRVPVAVVAKLGVATTLRLLREHCTKPGAVIPELECDKGGLTSASAEDIRTAFLEFIPLSTPSSSPIAPSSPSDTYDEDYIGRQHRLAEDSVRQYLHLKYEFVEF